MSESLIDFINAMNEDFTLYCSQVLGDCGLSQGQITFLVYIGDHPNCSPSDISRDICADSGYTTRTVKKLESCGMAIRESHERDRRACMLRLTDAGMAKFYQVRTIYEDWESEMTSGLDDIEREMLLRIMRRMGRR